MNKRALVLLAVSLLSPSVAAAQEGGGAETGHSRSLGVGVQSTMAGVSLASVVFETGKLHFDGLLSFASIDNDPGDDTTLFVLGGRVWFAVAQAERADFSIGGGLNLEFQDDGGADDTDVGIEAGAQIRAFLVPNVSFQAQLGLVIAPDDDILSTFGDDGGFSLGGLVGALGVVYFF